MIAFMPIFREDLKGVKRAIATDGGIKSLAKKSISVFFRATKLADGGKPGNRQIIANE